MHCGSRQGCPSATLPLVSHDGCPCYQQDPGVLTQPTEGVSYVNPSCGYTSSRFFFMEGSAEEARNLPTLLDIFSYCLGLDVNHAKSTFVGFGLSLEEAQTRRIKASNWQLGD